MTETKRLSLHGRLRMEAALPGYNASLLAEAADAIERHEAFTQEVSDAVADVIEELRPTKAALLSRFIIAKFDPLVEALTELHWAYDDNGCKMADELRKAIEARGGKIVWGEG